MKSTNSIRNGNGHSIQRYSAGIGYSSFEESRFSVKAMYDPSFGGYERDSYSYKQGAGIPYKSQMVQV